MARVSATVTIYMSELLYDIKNKTYLTGRSRNDGTNHESVAVMQANDDEENQNQILRSIGSAFSSLTPKLGEYITSASTTANDALISSATNLSLSLSMPENYNKADLNAVASGIHQYIVNSSVSDWFVITNPNEAAAYANLAAADIALVRESLAKRVRPTRTAPVVG